MDNQEKLIARLFKDRLMIFLLLVFVATIDYVTDGINTRKFFSIELIAANVNFLQ